MSNPDFQPKLSPRFAVYLRDYLMDRNVDPASIFNTCGIDQVTESDSALPIATTKVTELLDHAAYESNDPLLGFNMALNYHFESSAVIILAMLSAPTVAEALETLVYFDKYVDSGIAVSGHFTVDSATLTANLIGVDGKQTAHLNEYLITFLASALTLATRKKMPVYSVDFQHTRRKNAQQLREYFDAEVSFAKPKNVLRFDGIYLQEHMLSSNALLHEIVIGALKTFFSADVREYGFIDHVCRELMRQPEIENANLRYVANGLSMSERTLRRRMKSEGFTFLQVKALARERQSKYYLSNTNMTLADIAFSVGYSEPSSFSRAFKRWTDATPQEYRIMARKVISG